MLSQGYIATRLEKSFEKFYGRYENLIAMTLDNTTSAWLIDFCHKAI